MFLNGYETTALEAVEGYDLTGYNVIVTGGNSGIGVETVRALAKAGATVFLTSRNVENGQKVADEIKQSTGNNNVFVEQLELDSLENVRAFVARFLAKDLPLHILINNAGVMACPLSYTKDGFEMQIGTNHFGHFVLSTELLPALKRAYKETGRNSRVVNVSSCAHAHSDIDYDDYNFKTREYNEWVSYGQSKTANVLFSVALTERFAKEGVYSNAVMPGVIMTNLARHIPTKMTKEAAIERFGRIKTIEQGAATTVWAAVGQELDGKGGLYLEDCVVSIQKESQEEIFKTMFGYLKFAVDPENASKLWDLSEKLTKQQ